MKLGVRIMPKSEVLDSQGRAVERTLNHSGQKIQSVRVGKYIVLELPTDDKNLAIEQTEKIAQTVLHNSLIETYEIEVLG